MMNNVWRGRAKLSCAVWTALLAALSGCQRPTSSTIELVSYKDPYFPQPYKAVFSDCAYRIDTSGDIYVAGRGEQGFTSGVIQQYLQLHVFWKPHPGKTPSHSTSTDATIRYVIVSQAGVASYAGTGFVYTTRSWPGDTLNVAIEDARLRLESQVGEAVELLGEARLNGTLKAANNPNRTVDFTRELELHAAGAKQ